jgi:cyclophilin family peptidyl-prolyl cis-trans isomerase
MTRIFRISSGIPPQLGLFVLFLIVHESFGLTTPSIDRRTLLELLPLLPAFSSSASALASKGYSSFPIMPDESDKIPITDKVFFDVRVARQDGSTYVRDDLPDTFENRVLKVRLVFGLYGTVAPNHVQRFLSYVVSPSPSSGTEEDVENPYPSYSRSSFTSLEQSTGLLKGGYIPSMNVKEIGGSTAITYGSRVFPATLWIDQQSSSTTIPNGKLSHTTKGLLTHKTLDPLPTFGITTRACPELDTTHTIFGQILWDEATLEWFENLQDIPTYRVDRPSEYSDRMGGVVPATTTTAVFNAQRQFFRGAAKSVGDTRVSKLYEGKLLRRTEVMQVGKLP